MKASSSDLQFLLFWMQADFLLSRHIFKISWPHFTLCLPWPHFSFLGTHSGTVTNFRFVTCPGPLLFSSFQLGYRLCYLFSGPLCWLSLDVIYTYNFPCHHMQRCSVLLVEFFFFSSKFLPHVLVLAKCNGLYTFHIYSWIMKEVKFSQSFCAKWLQNLQIPSAHK